MHEKVIDVEGENMVWAVDVSPDSTRFATGTSGHDATIWDITSGKRLIGPLKHVDNVTGVRFSPNSAQFATACEKNSIRIFDSHSGDELVTIKIDIPNFLGTPLAWSSQQIFAASSHNKIRSFNTSTGSQLAELQIPDGDGNYVFCVAQAAKLIATFAGHSISFLDISTLALIGPVIEDSEKISSIAISPDGTHLATGGESGIIVVRDLGKIIPDLWRPLNVSICPFKPLACQIGRFPFLTLTKLFRHLLAKK
ncbi:WD40-repeat-containing domain protein [Butyriboletus roseoflavus]|nr:WD40-repeat-containing domain protein [Butyriboletus roseoflavus]